MILPVLLKLIPSWHDVSLNLSIRHTAQLSIHKYYFSDIVMIKTKQYVWYVLIDIFLYHFVMLLWSDISWTSMYNKMKGNERVHSL